MGMNLSCLFPEIFHIILYEHQQGGKGVMCENEIMSDLCPDGCSNPMWHAINCYPLQNHIELDTTGYT
jgi:hypothetical protein